MGHPFEVLLIAERCAILTGRDEDFVMWVTCGWCGTRWGELMATRRSVLHGDKLAVDSQLAPPDGPGFRRTPPKEGSFRNDHPDFFGMVDLPPFLTELLAWQADQYEGVCRCSESCGGVGYLLAPDRGHMLHGTYGQFPWRPAVDGLTYARKEQNRRPVLVDVAEPWPGLPLSPGWPMAAGPMWEPPCGRGEVRHDLPVSEPLRITCPHCAAGPGKPCLSETGRAGHVHRTRVAAEQEGRPERLRSLASWLPIKPGLTPHELRHSQRVWLDEDGLPEVLKKDRLGHAMSGMSGTYAHVSASMRARVKECMQQRWESALDQRAALSPRSPVGVLDRLLGERARALHGFMERA
ncbi:zinc finger domain-containing protein [Actinomadura harenae]|uniref:DNA-binding phage zinc finger domain-containing protein n=1 Tax=Actinomadura harenae TaxID=2483351 RepID=A0A3M2KXN3_9ACTN|nr:hypothetical protein [Actinomadura harenae]RMI30011.1 hypothetical protein EBO15_43145 [Actinomadura harenae]